VIVLGESYCLAWLKAKSHQSAANLLATLDPVGRLLVFGMVVYGFQRGSVIDLLSGVLGLHVLLLATVVVLTLRFARREEGVESNDHTSLFPGKSLLRSGITFGLIGLVAVVQNRLDWLLVSTYVGKVELASYSLANKAYEMLVLFMGVAMMTAYPWICRRDADALFRMKINIILFSLLTFGTIASLGASLYLPDLLSWIWEQKYEEARLLLQLLLPVAALSTVIVILYYQLVARERERSLLAINLVSTGIQFLVNLWLIPRVGAVGAVVGMATLALVNIACFSLLACQAGILSVNQIWRTASFLVVMFSLAFILWWSRISLEWGSPALIVIGLTAGCSILLPSREQRWLWVFVKRTSWGRVQVGTGEAT
jgi:O-antigen/teichoic acid export membrane protein